MRICLEFDSVKEMQQFADAVQPLGTHLMPGNVEISSGDPSSLSEQIADAAKGVTVWTEPGKTEEAIANLEVAPDAEVTTVGNTAEDAKPEEIETDFKAAVKATVSKKKEEHIPESAKKDAKGGDDGKKIRSLLISAAKLDSLTATQAKNCATEAAGVETMKDIKAEHVETVVTALEKLIAENS